MAQNYSPIGIFSGQGLFEDDGTGSGIADARKSFVSMLNTILARTPVAIDRPQTVAALTKESPIFENLIWHQTYGSTQVETVPPNTMWDERVFSLEERDALVHNKTVSDALLSGETFRVLVDGLGNQDAPQWSVWEAAAGAADVNDLETNQTQVYSEWARSSALGYFSDYSKLPTYDESSSWTVSNTAVTSGESRTAIGFITPNSMLDYRHSVQVTGLGTTDGVAGVIVAFALEGNKPTYLALVRSNVAPETDPLPDGGSSAMLRARWGLVKFSVLDGGTIFETLVDMTDKVPLHFPAPAGWDASGPATIFVERNGNTITAKTSQFGGSSLDAKTLLTYEIPVDSPYAQARQVGYMAWGQEASFSNSSLYYINDTTAAFTLAKGYDYKVDTLHERDLLPLATTPPKVGAKVLVTGDPLTDGFWSVWEYLGSSRWKIVYYQTYRTKDFWSYADWYATGYSPTVPPVVTYANDAARNVAEGLSPTTTFVKINDDGEGRWAWTVFNSGVWTIVARQSSTIQLSSKIYTKGRVKIGLDPIKDTDIIDYSGNQSKVPSRDAGWDLRTMFNALTDANCLTDAEINELFFSMLHFCHAQQDQVTWAFKTSFMTIGGYNEALRAVPVQPVDNTQNLLSFVNEVQPYRVHTREFKRIVSPDMEVMHTTTTDFDGQPFDPDLSRRFKITMRYDRVDHMPIFSSDQFIYSAPGAFGVYEDTTDRIVDVYVNDVQLFPSEFTTKGRTVTLKRAPEIGSIVRVDVREDLTAGLAADRIQSFYHPAPNGPEKNLRDLMGLNAKNKEFSGGDFDMSAADFELNDTANANTTINSEDEFFTFGGPIQKDRPEELIITHVSDGLNIVVKDLTNNVSWRMVQSAPGIDQMAPVQIGDFDARPLEDALYDTGYVGQTVDIGNGVVRGVYVIKPGSWEYVNWNNIAGTLANDIHEDANAIVINGGANITPPRREQIKAEGGNGDVSEIVHPGVVWINNERIEFFDIEFGSGKTTLKELRRGTYNTRIGVEQTIFAHSTYSVRKADGNTVIVTGNITGPVDSSNTVFKLTGVTSIDNLVVMSNETLRYPSGEIIKSDGYTGYPINVAKFSVIDYTATISGNELTVTFKRPPAAGTVLYFVIKNDDFHLANSQVRDGLDLYDGRPDSDLGGSVEYEAE